MIGRETVPNAGASMYIAKLEEKNLQKKKQQIEQYAHISFIRRRHHYQ